jgi:hypothetical protein
MATVKQIQLRLGQAKKKLTKLSKEVAATKAKIVKLGAQLKKAKAAAKVKPRPKPKPRAKVKRKKAPAKRKRKAPARRARRR